MTDEQRPREVVVVGGGISGLAAAYFLRRAAGPSVHVTVLEKAAVVGGHLRVSEVAGVPVDEGAESLLNRRPEAVELVRDVGLGDDLVHPAQLGTGLWTTAGMVPLPEGTVMGVPADPRTLAGVLTPAEVARVEQDRSMPGMPLHDDVPVGRFVADRMGAAVTERLVEPLLGGVYAGRANELSLRATVPALAQAAASQPSLLAAAEAVHRAGDGADLPMFAGIRGGVGRLPAAAARASAAHIRTGVTVRRLIPRPVHHAGSARPAGSPGSRWRLEIGPASSPEIVEADAVVVAVPAAPASRLLRDAVPDAATLLAQVEAASVAIVSLALPRDAFARAPAMSGFLVPPVDGRAAKAVTFSSVKWPWLGSALADDLVVLRASVGRHRSEFELQRDDDELVQVVRGELGEALGLRGEPVDARVTRWGGALPQYAVGHAERMARVLAVVDAVPGLAVCGAVYEGVGVAACVAGARRAATVVLDDLGLVPVSKP